MPDIPTYEAAPDIHMVGQPQASPGALGVPGGQLAQAAEDVERPLTEFARRYKDAKRTATAANLSAGVTADLGELARTSSLIPDNTLAMATYNKGVADRRAKLLANPDANDPFVAQVVTADFDREAALRGVDVSHESFTRWASKLNGVLDTNTEMYAEQYGAAHGNAALQATIKDKAINAINANEASGALQPEDAAKRRIDFTSNTQFYDIKAEMLRLKARGDVKGLDALDNKVQAEGSFPGLTDDHRVRLDSLIQNTSWIIHQRQLEAEQRGQVAARRAVTDAMFDAEHGGPVTHFSDATIEQAFPDGAKEIISRMRLAEGFYKSKQALALTSHAEDMAALQNWSPDGKIINEKAPPWQKRLDIESSERAHAAFLTALKEKQNALKADAPGYVLQFAPEVAASYTAALQDPSKWTHAYAQMDTMLDHLGVPRQNRSLIPANMAQGLAADIAADPSKAPAKLAKLQIDAHSTYWPRLMKDMITAGGLPETYQGMATLDDNPNDAGLIARWATETQAKPGLKARTASELIGEKEANAIKANILGSPAVDAYRRSLTGQGMGAQQAGGIINSMVDLAYARRYYSGDGNAAMNAITSFTGKYEYMPNGSARAPTDKFPTVLSNAQMAVNNLKLSNLTVPPSYNHKDMDYAEYVRRSPFWVQAPEGHWWWLKDGANQIVKDKNGHPIAVKIDAPLPPFHTSGGSYETFGGGP